MTYDADDDYVFMNAATPADQLVHRSCRRKQKEDRKAALEVARGLDAAGGTRNQRRARVIRECGMRVWVYYDGSKPAAATWPFPWRCGERLCPGCSRRRDLELLARRQPYLLEAPSRGGRLVDVTLTQRVRAWESVAEAEARLRERWRRLYRRRAFKGRVLGWILAFQVTSKPGRGFHLHAHGVLEVTPEFRFGAFKAAWRAAGRARAGVVVRAMQLSDLPNWFVYMAEPDAIADPSALRRMATMTGRHAVTAGGTLHARRFPEVPVASVDTPATSATIVPLTDLVKRAASGDAAAGAALAAVGKRASSMQKALDRLATTPTAEALARPDARVRD